MSKTVGDEVSCSPPSLTPSIFLFFLLGRVALCRGSRGIGQMNTPDF